MLAAEAPRQQELSLTTIRTFLIQQGIAALAFFRQSSPIENLKLFAKKQQGVAKTPEQVRQIAGGCGNGTSKDAIRRQRRQEKKKKKTGK